MKKLIFFLFSLLCIIAATAQTPFIIATDTLRLYNLSGSNTAKPVLKILNKYKDSVGYVLQNIGNGNYVGQPQTKYLDSLRRFGINVFGYRNGVAIFQYTDSVGAGGGGGPANTDFLPEGSVNLYYTNIRARNAFSSTNPLLTYNNTTGQFGLGFTGVDTTRWGQDISIYNSNGSIPGTRNIDFQNTGILNLNNALAFLVGGTTGRFGIQGNPTNTVISHFEVNGASQEMIMGGLGDGGTRWQSTWSNGNVGIGLDSIDRMRINGLLGVATDDPEGDSLLVIDPATGLVRYKNLVTTLAPYFKQNGNSFGDTARLGTVDNNPLLFKLNNVSKGIFAQNGRFGIGTINPSSTLEVVDTVGTASLIVRSNNASGSILAIRGGSAQLQMNASTASILTPQQNMTIDQPSVMGSVGSYTWIRFYNPNQSQISGNGIGIYSEQVFNPSSGTSTHTNFRIGGTINQTGGANGITRGIHITTSLASAVDYRAIQIDTGSVYLDRTSTPTQSSLGTNLFLVMDSVTGKINSFAGSMVSDTVNNGLSKFSGISQLGQSVGASGNPGSLLNNREIPLNGFNIHLTGSTGVLKVGDNSSSSTARVQINSSTAFSSTPYLALGPFLSNSIYNTLHTSDTVTVANEASVPVRGYQMNRNLVIGSNGNINLTGKNGAAFVNVLRVRDTLTMNASGHNNWYANSSQLSFLKAGGYSGRSAILGGVDGLTDAPNAFTAELVIGGSTGANNFRFYGSWVSLAAELAHTASTQDTIDHYISVWANSNYLGRILKAQYFRGFNLAPNTDSLWSVYFDESSAMGYHQGNFGIGTRVPLYKLDVNGTIRATKDSIPIVGSITSERILIQDSITGQFKRIAATALPGGGGVTAHSALTGLGADDHTQYALLAGRASGQTLIGGTATTDDLVFRTTSGVGATGSDMIFQGGNNGSTEFARFLNNGNLGIGVPAPTENVDIAGKLRIRTISSGTMDSLLTVNDGVIEKVTSVDFDVNRTIVTYSANQSALATDPGKYVLLSGASTTVNYLINPASFTGKTIRIKCIDATNTVKITLSSGTIDGFSEMQLLLNDVRWVTSDGTNLFVVSN